MCELSNSSAILSCLFENDSDESNNSVTGPNAHTCVTFSFWLESIINVAWVQVAFRATLTTTRRVRSYARPHGNGMSIWMLMGGGEFGCISFIKMSTLCNINVALIQELCIRGSQIHKMAWRQQDTNTTDESLGWDRGLSFWSLMTF